MINKNLSDITHDESLMTTDNGGSSVNWILGHIILNRDYLLQLLGIDSMSDEKMEKIYDRGTQSVTKEEAVPLTKLLELYNGSQEKLMKALDENDIRGDQEKMDNIPGLSFHEAYHAGQLGILRRVIGKAGMIQ